MELEYSNTTTLADKMKQYEEKYYGNATMADKLETYKTTKPVAVKYNEEIAYDNRDRNDGFFAKLGANMNESLYQMKANNALMSGDTDGYIKYMGLADNAFAKIDKSESEERLEEHMAGGGSAFAYALGNIEEIPSILYDSAPKVMSDLINVGIGGITTAAQAAVKGYMNIYEFAAGKPITEGMNPIIDPLAFSLQKRNEQLNMADGLAKEESRQLVKTQFDIANGKVPATPEMVENAKRFVDQHNNGKANALATADATIVASMLGIGGLANKIGGKGLVSGIKKSAAIGGGYGGSMDAVEQYSTTKKIDPFKLGDSILFTSALGVAPTAAIGVPVSTVKPIVKTAGKVVNGGINIAKDARDKVKGRVDSVKEEELKNYEEIDPETNEPIIKGSEEASTPIKNEEPRVSNNGEILNDELWEEFRKDPDAVKAYKQKNKEVVDKKVAEAEARIAERKASETPKEYPVAENTEVNSPKIEEEVLTPEQKKYNREVYDEFKKDPEAQAALDEDNGHQIAVKYEEAKARVDARREAAKPKAEETQSTEQSIIPKDEPLIEAESKATPKKIVEEEAHTFNEAEEIPSSELWEELQKDPEAIEAYNNHDTEILYQKMDEAEARIRARKKATTPEPAKVKEEPVKKEPAKVEEESEISHDELWEELYKDEEAMWAMKNQNGELFEKKIAEAEARIRSRKKVQSKPKVEEPKVKEEVKKPAETPKVEPEAAQKPKSKIEDEFNSRSQRDKDIEAELEKDAVFKEAMEKGDTDTALDRITLAEMKVDEKILANRKNVDINDRDAVYDVVEAEKNVNVQNKKALNELIGEELRKVRKDREADKKKADKKKKLNESKHRAAKDDDVTVADNYDGRSGNLGFLKLADEKKIKLFQEKMNEMYDMSAGKFRDFVVGLFEKGEFKYHPFVDLYKKMGKDAFTVMRDKGTGHLVLTLSEKGKKAYGLHLDMINISQNKIAKEFAMRMFPKQGGEGRVKSIRGVLDSLGVKKTSVEELGEIYRPLSELFKDDLGDVAKNRIRGNFNKKIAEFLNLDREKIQEFKQNRDTRGAEAYYLEKIKEANKEKDLGLTAEYEKLFAQNLAENTFRNYTGHVLNEGNVVTGRVDKPKPKEEAPTKPKQEVKEQPKPEVKPKVEEPKKEPIKPEEEVKQEPKKVKEPKEEETPLTKEEENVKEHLEDIFAAHESKGGGLNNEGKAILNKVFYWLKDNDFFKEKDVISYLKGTLKDAAKIKEIEAKYNSLVKSAIRLTAEGKNPEYKATPRQVAYLAKILDGGLYKRAIFEKNKKNRAEGVDVEKVRDKRNIDSYEKRIRKELEKGGFSKEMGTIFLSLIKRRFGLDEKGKYSEREFAKNIDEGKVPELFTEKGKGFYFTELQEGAGSIISVPKRVIKSLARLISKPEEAVINMALMHELGHALEHTLTKEERAKFVEMFGDPNFVEKIGVDDIYLNKENFAMAFANFMMNSEKMLGKEAYTSRNRILKHSLKTSMTTGEVTKFVKMINEKFNAIIDAVLKYITGNMKGNDKTIYRGEYSKEFTDNVVNNPAFISLMEDIFGVSEKTNDVKYTKADVERLAKYSNISNYFDKGVNTLLHEISMGEIRPSGGKDGVLNAYHFNGGDKKTQLKIAHRLAERIFTKFFEKLYDENSHVHKIIDVYDKFQNISLVQKMKADWNTSGMKSKFTEALDIIKDMSMKEFSRYPNEQATAAKKFLQEATKDFSEEEKEFITRIMLHTEIQNITLGEFLNLSEWGSSSKRSIELYKEIKELITDDELVLDKIHKDIKSLIIFMSENRNTAGKNLHTSVEQIMHNIEKSLNYEFKDRELVESTLKKYVTYKALNNLGDKEIMFLTKNREKLADIYGLVKHYKDRYIEQIKANGDIFSYAYGNAREPTNSKQRIYTLTEKEFKKSGLSEKNIMIETETINEYGKRVRAYVVSELDVRAPRTEGVISYVEPRFSGDLVKYHLSGGMSIPIKNSEGRVVGYKLLLDRKTAKERAGTVENIVDVFGSYVSHVEKYMVRDKINNAIKYSIVSDMGEAGFVLSKDNMPIMLEASSIYKTPKKLKDQLYFDALAKLKKDNPKQKLSILRREAREMANKYVPLSKDMALPKSLRSVKLIHKAYADQLMGYKKFFYQGDNKIINLAQTVLSDVTNTFKQNVIFKSIPTLVNNIAFNYLVTLSTIPLDKNWAGNAYWVTKEAKKISGELREYSKLVAQRERLKLERNIAETNGRKFNKQAEIDSLNKQIEKTGMEEFNDKGFIQSIVDEVITENSESNIIGHYTKKGIEIVADKVGLDKKKTVNALKTAYMTPDTKIGSALSSVSRYGDYTFRIAMYRLLTERLKMDKAKAKEYALESFIDYRNTLPFEIAALENTGLVPFAGWLMRMQGAIGKLAKNNPKAYMLMLLASGFIDLPIRTQSMNPINTLGLSGIGDMLPWESSYLFDIPDKGIASPAVTPGIFNDIAGGRLDRLAGFTMN